VPTDVLGEKNDSTRLGWTIKAAKIKGLSISSPWIKETLSYLASDEKFITVVQNSCVLLLMMFAA
jgi:hypothetical protein